MQISNIQQTITIEKKHRYIIYTYTRDNVVSIGVSKCKNTNDFNNFTPNYRASMWFRPITHRNRFHLFLVQCISVYYYLTTVQTISK